MNWTSAESYCQSTYGRHLATISSSIDNTYARIAATDAGVSEGDALWIGYNDIDSEGNFTWIDGSGEGNYTNWKTGEPNNQGTEDCAQMFGSGLWNDRGCDYTRKIVCNAPGNIAFAVFCMLFLFFCDSSIF